MKKTIYCVIIVMWVSTLIPKSKWNTVHKKCISKHGGNDDCQNGIRIGCSSMPIVL